MSYLNRVLLYELEDIVGAENVTDKRADLDAVSTDVCSIRRFCIDRGREPVTPDVIVSPQTTDQVSKVLRFANTWKIPVTPRGGGAGDTCGALPIFGGIVLDLGKMDRVLVDAPCSGLGTLRRSPDLKWRQTPETVAAQAELQGRILASAARLVKPGGRLVYATCSLLPQENEAVAEAFTREHPDFEVLPVSALLAAAHVVDSDQLVAGEGGCFLRLWPHRHATDGFFAAVWTKKP